MTVNSERIDAKAQAIEEALSRIGEPVTEAQAKDLATREDCDCKEGMFALAGTRRALFGERGHGGGGRNDRRCCRARPQPKRRPEPSNMTCRPTQPRSRAA